MNKSILVDIDHTLSDARWRDTMLEGADKWNGWDAYHAEGIHDEPIEEMILLCNSLHHNGYPVVGITVRPDKWRQMTSEWLYRNKALMDELLMRPGDDFLPAVQCKMALATDRFGPVLKDHVAMIIDDREDVCVAFRAMGVMALQVMI